MPKLIRKLQGGSYVQKPWQEMTFDYTNVTEPISWFNGQMNKGSTYGISKPIDYSKLQSPQVGLDFSAKTFKGATLPQNQQKIDDFKFPNTGFSDSSSRIGAGFNAEKWGKTSDKITTGLNLISGTSAPLDHISNASNALKLAGNIAGNFGPYGKIAEAGIAAFTTLDQLTGKKAKSQLTAGEAATGYDLNFNANASTSYGGILGNRKRRDTNNVTANNDYSNTLKIGISNAQRQNNISVGNSMQDTFKRNDWQQRGGPNYNMLSASKGTKLNLTKIARQVAKKLTTKQEESKTNIIPSGALHARKHNLPEDIADQVTHKGIPIVTFEDDGKIVQHCEVEREELTLHKELTVKLEDLFSQYKNASDDEKDKMLIKTGKLLTYEILENTQDNVNLIDKIE